MMLEIRVGRKISLEYIYVSIAHAWASCRGREEAQNTNSPAPEAELKKSDLQEIKSENYS